MCIKYKKCIFINFAIFLFLIISTILSSCSKFTKSNSSNILNGDTPKQEINLTINYVLPDYIYNSKDELFYDFFLDFYEYICLSPGGSNRLKNYGIENINDFYNICSNFYKSSATGFPQVGNILSPYFLYQRRGSNFKEQKDKDFFIGYCLRNNKYVKFFDFLETFFYHYRMDEGYTGPISEGKDPYGSDFFASSYASIIDTVKFFYYTKDTLPVFFYEKNNIPNLYDKIPGILQKPFDTKNSFTYDLNSDLGYALPTNFNCYAYQFIGWYNEPNFSSDPITHIDNTYITNNNINSDNNTITLYAKFIDMP